MVDLNLIEWFDRQGLLTRLEPLPISQQLVVVQLGPRFQDDAGAVAMNQQSNRWGQD